MKKRVLLSFVVVVLLFVISGCQNDNDKVVGTWELFYDDQELNAILSEAQARSTIEFKKDNTYCRCLYAKGVLLSEYHGTYSINNGELIMRGTQTYMKDLSGSMVDAGENYIDDVSRYYYDDNLSSSDSYKWKIDGNVLYLGGSDTYRRI